MSRAININSPGVRSMMAAAFSSEAGLTADELAERAGITKGTAATYIAPLLAMESSNALAQGREPIGEASLSNAGFGVSAGPEKGR